LGTNPRNVGTILNVQKPTTKKELRGLIGLINFYGRFIPKKAEILEPLTRLTNKKAACKTIGVKNKIGQLKR